MHVCTRFCVCAGHCASMGMSGGHGIHAKHMGEGCSRHALYMHVTMHIHAWDHAHTCMGTHTVTDTQGPALWGYTQAFCRVHVLQRGLLYLFFKVYMHRHVGGHGFAWPLCNCVGTCFCACVCTATCIRVYPCLFTGVCALPGACALLQGLGLGSCSLQHDFACLCGARAAFVCDGCG